MATIITYNGISIYDCLTQGVEVAPVTAPGGDLMYTKIRVTVTGIIREYSVHNSLGVVVDDFAKDAMNVLGYLTVPRRRFTMTVDNRTFMTVAPGAVEVSAQGANLAKRPNEMDVNNGPVPSARILQITGRSSARIEFSCEMAVHPCNNLDSSGVTCFRFWSGDDIDGRTWLTTRRHDGFLRVANRNFNPQSLRMLYPFLPPLAPRFERVHVKYDTSPDGLELRFNIVDQERHATAPFPATDMECDYSITLGQHNVHADAELRISLTAPATVPKSSLHALAAKITEQKLHIEDQSRVKSLFFLYSVVNESYRHNRVEWVSRIRAFPYEKRGAYGIFKDELGKGLSLPGYQPWIPSAAARPTASKFGLFLTALQNPCSPATLAQYPTPPVGQPEKKAKNGDTDSQPYASTPVPPQTSQNYIDESQRSSGFYSMFRLTSDYRNDTGLATFPVGKTSNGRSVAAVRLHQGYSLRRIRIEAERLNSWPELPRPDNFRDNNITYVLQSWRPMPHAARISADGAKLLCACDYEMEFALDRPLGANDDLAVGNLPFLRPLGYQLQSYQSSNYAYGGAILGVNPN